MRLDLDTAEQAARLLSNYNCARQSQVRLREQAGRARTLSKREELRRAAALMYERAVGFRAALYELTGITVSF